MRSKTIYENFNSTKFYKKSNSFYGQNPSVGKQALNLIEARELPAAQAARKSKSFYTHRQKFFLLTPHPTLSHKGRGELEEKTFGRRYKKGFSRGNSRRSGGRSLDSLNNAGLNVFD
jgi:hypothetical protein